MGFIVINQLNTVHSDNHIEKTRILHLLNVGICAKVEFAQLTGLITPLTRDCLINDLNNKAIDSLKSNNKFYLVSEDIDRVAFGVVNWNGGSRARLSEFYCTSKDNFINDFNECRYEIDRLFSLYDDIEVDYNTENSYRYKDNFKFTM